MSANNLSEINKKIKNLGTTNKITKAMKLIAMASLPKLKNNLNFAKLYHDKIQELFLKTIISSDAKDSILMKNIIEGFAEEKELLVIFSPQKGFCGSLIHEIEKEIERFLKNAEHKGAKILLFGSKVDIFLKNCNATFIDFKDGDFDDFLNIIKTKKFSKIEFLYSQFQSMLVHDVKAITPIPVSIGHDSECVMKIDSDPIFTKEIVATLLAKSLFYLYQSHSKLTEAAVRAMSMDAANRNVIKLMDKFVLAKNKARQAKVTNELIDIISGANI